MHVSLSERNKIRVPSVYVYGGEYDKVNRGKTPMTSRADKVSDSCAADKGANMMESYQGFHQSIL
ncbi:hypothetical protein J6590_004561 [Homalodisca vitripennis]|nr:hypothetical protein J6590_004561 [Homalodisca vitripennis]